MYKAVDRITPTYLTKIFENINSVHSYNLRNSEFNICVPRQYTETGKNSFYYQGVVLWDGLSSFYTLVHGSVENHL